MQARIRHYTAGSLESGHLLRSGRQMVSALASVAGFVSFVLLDLGGGRLASITICDAADGLDTVDDAADTWLAEQILATEVPNGSESGEIILQRGL